MARYDPVLSNNPSATSILIALEVRLLQKARNAIFDSHVTTYNIKYDEELTTATSTSQVLYNNSFYKGAFLQKAISWLEEKIWRDASKRRTDPATLFLLRALFRVIKVSRGRTKNVIYVDF